MRLPIQDGVRKSMNRGREEQQKRDCLLAQGGVAGG